MSVFDAVTQTVVSTPTVSNTVRLGFTLLLQLLVVQACTDNSKEATKCRFYESVFPVADEFVVVKTTRISEMGAYAELLEYDFVEGMMLYPEIGRRKTRPKHTLFKLGRMEVVRVIRVDKEKGMLLLWNSPLLSPCTFEAF